MPKIILTFILQEVRISNNFHEGVIMKDKSELTAWFRYGVISSILCRDDNRSLKSALSELSGRMWVFPNNEMDYISYASVENWYYAFRKGGIEALMPKKRKDCGISREISVNIQEAIDKLLNQYSNLKTSNIIRLLAVQDNLRDEMPGKSTVYRYVKTIRKKYSDTETGQQRLAFEAPYSGNLWQTDIMYGPYLYCKIDGVFKKQQTYLIAIIDDHSRLIVHGEFFFSQCVEDYGSVLKTACLKRGIPEKLYCDNGKVFLSGQIKRIAAKLGITVLHTKVRDAAAKGKIEKYFGYVRTGFLEKYRITGLPKSLEELNDQYHSWLEIDYNNRVHSGIKMKPIEKWLMSAHKVRTVPADKEYSSFLFSCERVVKKNGTFTIASIPYETCYTLASKKVQIDYDPLNRLGVYVNFEGKDYGKANLLDVHLNNNLPRKKYKREKNIND